MKGKKTGGREAGTPNKLSTTVRQTVLDVFNKLQQDNTASLEWFARNYPKEFYLIASKLIPTEITGAGGKDLIPIQPVVSSQQAANDINNLK
jgi:hypothetical protein